MSKHPAGKGSKHRQVNKKQYDKNYDAIFKNGSKKLQYIVVFPDGTTWSALENCKIVGITPEQADQLGDESRTVVDLVAPSCDITEMILRTVRFSLFLSWYNHRDQ